jgi:hypothetical protein
MNIKPSAYLLNLPIIYFTHSQSSLVRFIGNFSLVRSARLLVPDGVIECSFAKTDLRLVGCIKPSGRLTKWTSIFLTESALSQAASDYVYEINLCDAGSPMCKYGRWHSLSMAAELCHGLGAHEQRNSTERNVNFVSTWLYLLVHVDSQVIRFSAF